VWRQLPSGSELWPEKTILVEDTYTLWMEMSLSPPGTGGSLRRGLGVPVGVGTAVGTCGGGVGVSAMGTKANVRRSESKVAWAALPLGRSVTPSGWKGTLHQNTSQYSPPSCTTDTCRFLKLSSGVAGYVNSMAVSPLTVRQHLVSI
jgi:hypothetical protein